MVYPDKKYIGEWFINETVKTALFRRIFFSKTLA